MYCPSSSSLAMTTDKVLCTLSFFPQPSYDYSTDKVLCIVFFLQPSYDYRQSVKKLLPNLLVLDDERLDSSSSSMVKHNVFDDDWAYLEELQKDAFLQGGLGDEVEVGGELNSGGEFLL